MREFETPYHDMQGHIIGQYVLPVESIFLFFIVVVLKAGDILVQRGTIHTWVNRGSVPCVIAFVLVDARLPSFEGRQIDSAG